MHSMTGFGSGNLRTEAFEISVEISSVNHKSRDIRISLPPALQSLEPELVKIISREIHRGALNVGIDFQAFSARVKNRLKVDTDLLDDLCDQVKCVLDRHPGLTLDAGSWLTLPGVVQVIGPEMDRTELLDGALQAVRKALDAFQSQRAREGRALADDLREHHAILRALRDDMAGKAGMAAKSLHQRFTERISALGLELDAADERVAKELALLVQRADVNEELVRLQAHLDEFGRLIDGEDDEPVGRRLQFLCQEIHREINTLGSKTSESEISLSSLEFKTQLDRLREQVLNIE